MTSTPADCLVIGALPGSLINFRGPLLKAMREAGCRVFAAANGRDPAVEARLKELGVLYCPIRIERAGMNPLSDAVTLLDLIRLVRRVKPAVVLSYTIKPVIYGGLAARAGGVPSVYSLVTGLGYAFMESATFRQRWTSRIARFMYRMSLRHSRCVFFQNPDDSRDFITAGLVVPDQAVVVNGSGVDLARFPFSVPPGGRSGASGAAVRFLLIARLLKDKGIVEYVEAARTIKREHPEAEFHLVGPFDPNPAGLDPRVIESWEREGLIRFQGEREDVRPFLEGCDVYVLPSYREGTPRTVLEAMATGRPVITTAVSGCRETVRGASGEGSLKVEAEDGGMTDVRDPGGEVGRSDADGWTRVGKLSIGANGILIPPRDSNALADAMLFFIRHPGRIEAMGREGRRYAEERYDVHKVNEVILSEMRLR